MRTGPSPRTERPARIALALILLGLMALLTHRFHSPRLPESAAERPQAAQGAAQSASLAQWLDWAGRYHRAGHDQRVGLLEEGVAMARERRAWLLELIQSDPEAALAAALPRPLHAQMPAEIAEHLEQFVSARAPLEIVVTCGHGGVHADGAPCNEGDEHHSTHIDGRGYEAHVYGSRLKDLSIPETSLHGIVLDGHMAVSESRVRVLEPGEPLAQQVQPLPPGAIAVEANGEVKALPSIEALMEFEQALIAGEQNPVVEELGGGQGSSDVNNRPSAAWTHGNKTLLVIRVDYDDRAGEPINIQTGQPITEDDVVDVINGSGQVRTFFQEASFGKTDLLISPTVNGDSPDVTEVLRMPQTAEYYANTSNGSGPLGNDAFTAANEAGYVTDDYDLVLIITSNLNDKGTKFDTWAGRAVRAGKRSWYNGYWDFWVVAHELGHNYGLTHAGRWDVTDGDPISPAGSLNAYGDNHDTMGASGKPAEHFNHHFKSILHWVPDSAVTTADNTGVYRVHRLDHKDADLTLPRAIKITQDLARPYWIGYRRLSEFPHMNNGAYVLRGDYKINESELLDLTTPGNSINDAALSLNQTFTDAAAGVSMTPVAQGGTGADEWLDVQVTFTPRVSWAATEVVAGEQAGYATLTVNRTMNAAGAISVNYATANGSAVAPDDYTTTSGTLTWVDGDATPKTIQVPLVDDGLVEANETFTLTLSSPSGAMLDGSATTTVTLTDGGTAVAVPDVVGLAQASAESAIVAAELTVGTVTTAYSNTVAAGNVISQSPGAGLSVALGSPVNLVVSLGVQMVTVPDVEGLPQATAESNLVAAQLAVGVVTSEFSDTVPAGSVISQGLAAGSSVASGTQVDLLVSLGASQPPVVDAGTNQEVGLLAGGQDLWTPAELTTAIWLDAADAGSITQAGGEVSQWADKSGKGNHLTQGTSTMRPSYSASGWNGSTLPALSFDGTDDYLQGAAQKTYPALTIAAVYEQNRTSGNERPFGVRDDDGSSNMETLALGTDNSLRYDGGFQSGTIAAATGKCLRVATRSTTAQTDHIGGSPNISATTALPDIQGRFNLGRVAINLPLNHVFQGKVAECLAVEGVIDEPTRLKLEGYFAHKWGLAADLPDGHPYQSDPPTVAVASLDGTVTDEDSTPSTLWTMISGPATVTFGDASAVDTTVTFSATGTYVLRLTAIDGNHTVYDEVTVTVVSGTANPTVTFDANGGDAPAPGTKSVTYNSPYGTLATTNRTGYTFDGWFTASTGGTEVTASTTVTSAFDHTLHAQWTPDTYTVTFEANGGDPVAPSTKSVTFDAAYGALPAATRADYAFNGWFTADTGGTQVTAATTVTTAGNHTLYAQWIYQPFNHGTWLPTPGGTYDWGSAGNWVGGIIASGVDKTASFTPEITGDQIANLDAPRAIGNLTFTDGTNASNNLTISGASTLTLDTTSAAPVINVTQSGRTLALATALAGTDGLTKSGNGALTLSGDNSGRSGPTTLSAGTLNLNHATALGSGDFNLNGGTIDNTSGAPITLSTNNAITASSFTFGGSNDLDLGGGGVWMGNGDRSITLNGTGSSLSIAGKLSLNRANSSTGMKLTVNGAGNTLLLGSLAIGVGSTNITIQGSADVTVAGATTETINPDKALIKDGTGTLTLNGAYTSDSLTTVNGGALMINGDASAASGVFTVNSGGTLGGTGIIGADTTIADNGGLAFDISTPAASHDKLELVTGKSLTFSGASILTISSTVGNPALGSYVLLTAPGGITGSVPSTLHLPSGWAATVSKSVDGKDLILEVTALPESSVDSFAITGIPAQVPVASSVSGITITARDASNQTVTSFSGTVTYSGTAGITGTSATFSNGVLAGVSITPATTGNALTLIVTDGGGNTGTASFDVLTRYQSWATAHALTGGNSGPDDNPDSDAFTNLLEFAFGMNPTRGGNPVAEFTQGAGVTQAGAPRLMNFAAQGEAPDYRAVFLRRKDYRDAGLVYSVAFSADLVGWTPHEVEPTVHTDANSTGEMEAVSVPYPVDWSPAPGFFKVSVEMP